jgi:hypothetical protein
MTRKEKIKLFDKLDKENNEFNFLKHYVFYCNNCNFKDVGILFNTRGELIEWDIDEDE